MRVSSARWANQWARHISARASVVEMYDALCHKGVIEAHSSQRDTALLCGPLLDYVNSLPSCVPPFETAQQRRDAKQREERAFRARAHRQAMSAVDALAKWGEAARDKWEGFAPTALTVEWPGIFSMTGAGSAKARGGGTPEDESTVIDPHPASRGIYLWGNVGVGKTMLMDLFELCPTVASKRRAHLHSFVTDLHARVHVVQEEQRERRQRLRLGSEDLDDPIEVVAHRVVCESRVLCFDEFQTFDVANATLLASFFKHAFRFGIVLVATSNKSPEALCRIGTAFDEFVPLLRHHCAVVRFDGVGLANGNTRSVAEAAVVPDFRQRKAEAGSVHEHIFLSPNGDETEKRLLALVAQGFRSTELRNRALSNNFDTAFTLTCYRRTIRIPRRLGGLAVFDFRDLCGMGQPLGPADFQLIAQTFHTLVILGVPHIGTATRNAAKQWIVLVDEMYQRKVKLLFTSPSPWRRLFHVSEREDGDDEGQHYTEGEDERASMKLSATPFGTHAGREEVLSYERVLSRLCEMGSLAYLLEDHLDFIADDFDFSVYSVVGQRKLPISIGAAGSQEDSTFLTSGGTGRSLEK